MSLNKVKEHNKKIFDAYEDIKYIFENNHTLEQVTESLRHLEKELDTKNNALKYTNKYLYASMIIAFIICLLIYKYTGIVWIWLLIIPVYFIFRSKKHNESELRELIIQKKIDNIYDFSIDTLFGAETSDSITLNFGPYFKQGNYLNEIDQSLSGKFQLEFLDIPYSIFRYRYVDVYKDRNGKKKYTENYSHGVILYDVDASAFSIEGKRSNRTNYRISHEPSDNEFNNKYTIKGTDEMHLSRIFKPSFLESMISLLDSNLGINYIYSHNRVPILIFDININDMFKISHNNSDLNTIDGIESFMESVRMPQYDLFLEQEQLYEVFYNDRRGAI